MKRNPLHLLLAAVAAGFTLFGQAQESEPAESATVPSESSTEQAPEVSREDSANPPPPPREEFEPSEQISEDLSVSFPVDI